MRAIVKNYNSLVKKYQEIETDSSENEIHDKRVILRRIFPILEACKVNPSKVKNGKRAFNLFGKLRDTQVQLLKLESMEPNEETTLYIIFLKKHELKYQNKIVRFYEKKQVVFPSIKKTKINVGKFEKKAEKLLFKLLEKIQSISIEDAYDIHQIRIIFKKYRYMVEILSYIKTIDEEKLQNMKAYQDKLGEIQDYEVLIQGIKKFNKKKKLVDGVDAEIFESDQNTLIEYFDKELESFIKACREVLSLGKDIDSVDI